MLPFLFVWSVTLDMRFFGDWLSFDSESQAKCIEYGTECLVAWVAVGRQCFVEMLS